MDNRCRRGNVLPMALNSLRDLRKERGLTQEQLADLVGSSGPEISKLERGERKMTVDWVGRLASALNVEAVDLMPSDGPRRVKPKAAPAVGIPASNPVTGPDPDRTLPILGRAKGGAEGVILIGIDERPIDWTYRPPQLRNVEGAFGFFVTGDSMSPVYEEGDVGWVHPHMPPKRGKPVLVVKTNDEAILKRFGRRTTEALHLAQYNPADEEIIIPSGEVRRVYRVAGKWEGS